MDQQGQQRKPVVAVGVSVITGAIFYTSGHFWAGIRLSVGYGIYTWLSRDGCKPCSAWLLSRAEHGSHSIVRYLLS